MLNSSGHCTGGSQPGHPEITIPTDKQDQPKGFAYVDFPEPEAAEHAIEARGRELKGREVKVSRKRTIRPGLQPDGEQGRISPPWVRPAPHRPPTPLPRPYSRS